MFAGAPASSVNLATNVGPNALLKSASYPLPSSVSSGPLTAIPLPGGHSWWTPDDGSTGGFNWRSYWGTPTQAYVYDNNPSNLGGIIGAGGMTIDGFAYPAGVQVFQFMDLSAGTIAPDVTSPSLLLRGCRMRGLGGDTGWSNSFAAYSAGWRGSLYFHFCEFGQRGSADGQAGEFQLDTNGAVNVRIYRTYCSYYADGMFPNAASGWVDFIENMCDYPVYYFGDAGPSGTGTDNFHMAGMGVNGGQTCTLWLRNRCVWPAVDEAGHTLGGTAPFEFTQDAGEFLGTGTNSDGSAGFWISGNYCGGGNYCYYLGQRSTDPANSVTNMHFRGNLITTSTVSTGGLLGVIATVPTWGTNGNDQSGNLWADGPNAGTPFM
jgi:hypothetical protein